MLYSLVFTNVKVTDHLMHVYELCLHCLYLHSTPKYLATLSTSRSQQNQGIIMTNTVYVHTVSADPWFGPPAGGHSTGPSMGRQPGSEPIKGLLGLDAQPIPPPLPWRWRMLTHGLRTPARLLFSET